MANKPIELNNPEQKQYFRLLSSHRLPDFFGNLFEEPERALDFLHAFAKYRDEYRDDRWSGIKVIAQLRQQALTLTPQQVDKLCTIGMNKWFGNQLDLGTTLGIVFSSPANDIRHAAAIVQVINRAFLREDFYTLGTSGCFMAIVILIVTAAFTRTWALLTEGVKKAVPESEHAFGNFLWVMALLDKAPHFVGPESELYSVMEEGDWGKFTNEITKRIERGSEEQHRIPVMGDTAYNCNRFMKSVFGQRQTSNKEFQRLVAWFGAYEETFQDHAAQMWDEIEADTKFGLKPAGDIVKINVKSLRDNFWRYVQLLPGQDYMHFTARVWFYLPGDVGRVSVIQKLSKRRLHKVSEFSQEQDFAAIADKLQQFVALHSYWKIVTGKVFKVKVKKTAGGEKKREHLENSFLVRPHYRWLPPEYHASEEAIARSVAFRGAAPPPGKTFVRSTVTTEEIRASVSPDSFDRPTILYTEEDLGYTG